MLIKICRLMKKILNMRRMSYGCNFNSTNVNIIESVDGSDPLTNVVNQQAPHT